MNRRVWLAGLALAAALQTQAPMALAQDVKAAEMPADSISQH